MMGKTHLAIGVILLFFISRFTDLLFSNKLLGEILLIFATIFPDIDTASSIVGRRFKPIAWLFKHRGILHSIVGMVALTILAQLLFQNNNLSILFLIGYGSHLIADSVTKEGTTLFYPGKKKIKGPLRVGGTVETIIFIFLLVLFLYLFI